MNWANFVAGFFVGATALNTVWIIGMRRAMQRQRPAGGGE